MIQTITEKEALDMFAELFEVPQGSLTVATLKSDIEGWDSLGVLTLMAEYDSRFGIIFTQEELESFNCIGDLIQVLKKHNKLAGV